MVMDTPAVVGTAKWCCGTKTSSHPPRSTSLTLQRVTKVIIEHNELCIVVHYETVWYRHTGLCVRSVCVEGGKVLTGTKDGEVFETTTQNLDSAAAIVEVRQFHLSVL